MLNPLYVLLFLALLAFWWLYAKPGKERVVGFITRNMRIVIPIFWLLFAIMLSVFFISFDYLEDSHDIDDAIESATEYLSDGGNPYRDEVVPRFTEPYEGPDTEMVNGTYNYLPLDLIAYTGFRQLFWFLDGPIWFVLTNAIFSFIAAFLFWKTSRMNPLLLTPIAGGIFVFFSFDNVCFTALLVSAGLLFLYRPDSCYHPIIALIMFGLATLTKPFAALILLALLLAYLHVIVRERDRQMIIPLILGVLVICGIALLVILPFGIDNVVDSTLLFHADPDERGVTSIGGTPVYELIGQTSLYSLISGGIVIASLIISIRFDDLLNRLMIVEVVFLAVMIKSSFSAILLPAMIVFLSYILQSPRLSIFRFENPDLKNEKKG